MSKITQLGGYQEAAEVLAGLSGKRWSRQGVQQMWKRRAVNGFPDRESFVINGALRPLFRIQDVIDWYAFAEASRWLTVATGKLWAPSDVWSEWKNRAHTGFPNRKTVAGEFTRLAFDEDEIRKWADDQGKNDAPHQGGCAVGAA